MKTRSRPLAAAAAVAAIALLASCTSLSAMREPAAPAPGPEAFAGQTLSFGPCGNPPGAGPAAPGAECGRLEVPLDHADPAGPRAEIAVLRVPARGPDRIGSIVVNPGGPGVPGTDFATQMATTWAGSPITERFDVVGFDPRGVGGSTPALDCYTDAERDADAILASFTSGVEEWSEQETRQLVQSCAERSGGPDVLAHVGTRDAARDMDLLRSALGDEKLTYLGGSYGTRLGAVYAEMFPGNVRAMVFDGAMDPLAGSHERRVQQYAGLQRSFERLAASCASEPDCPLGPDPARATETFQGLARPLIDRPVPTSDGRGLTFVQAIDAVTFGLYSKDLWPVVVAGIADLKAGSGDTLLQVRDASHKRSPDGVHSDESEATMAINCLDEQRHTPEQEAAMKRAVFDAAPFSDTGRPVVGTRDGCEHWPAAPTLGYPYATGIDGLPDTLTVSVTGDALTPHQGGVRLAETLGGSLLTVDGEQHGAVPAGNACIDGIVTSYLVDLVPGPAGARCRL